MERVFLAETITIELSDEEETMITKVAQKYGQTTEEYCQAFAKWLFAPENNERVTSFLESIIREE